MIKIKDMHNNKLNIGDYILYPEMLADSTIMRVGKIINFTNKTHDWINKDYVTISIVATDYSNYTNISRIGLNNTSKVSIAPKKAIKSIETLFRCKENFDKYSKFFK